MTVIRLETVIAAPPERCFDLSLSVDVHLASAAETSERVVSGRSAGILALGDSVTWEARHLGRVWRLSVAVTAYDRPRMFRDEMLHGPFRRMRHDHYFAQDDHGTRMRDEFEFASRFPPIDWSLLKPHLRRFLVQRNETIRRIAEGEDWRRYIP